MKTKTRTASSDPIIDVIGQFKKRATLYQLNECRTTRLLDPETREEKRLQRPDSRVNNETDFQPNTWCHSAPVTVDGLLMLLIKSSVCRKFLLRVKSKVGLPASEMETRWNAAELLKVFEGGSRIKDERFVRIRKESSSNNHQHYFSWWHYKHYKSPFESLQLIKLSLTIFCFLPLWFWPRMENDGVIALYCTGYVITSVRDHFDMKTRRFHSNV